MHSLAFAYELTAAKERETYLITCYIGFKISLPNAQCQAQFYQGAKAPITALV